MFGALCFSKYNLDNLYSWFCLIVFLPHQALRLQREHRPCSYRAGRSARSTELFSVAIRPLGRKVFQPQTLPIQAELLCFQAVPPLWQGASMALSNRVILPILSIPRET